MSFERKLKMKKIEKKLLLEKNVWHVSLLSEIEE